MAYKISLKCLDFELYISSSNRKSQDFILHSSDCGMVCFASVCYDTMLSNAKSMQFLRQMNEQGALVELNLQGNWGLNIEKPRTERLSHGRTLNFSVPSSQKSVSCVISHRVATLSLNLRRR